MTTLNAVLFDLDGTLLDTARDLGGALNALLAQENLPAVSYEDYRAAVSHGGNALVSLGFGTSSGDERHQELYKQLLQHYSRNLATHTRLFEGMDRVLALVARMKLRWGIVTNKPRDLTLPLVRQLDIDPACDVIICPEDVSHRKPDPESLILACDRLQCLPPQAIYVGDHARDIEAGQRAGMPTVAARYGYISKGDNIDTWNADYAIDSPGELTDIIERLATNKTQPQR